VLRRRRAPEVAPEVTRSEGEWRERLTPQQYRVLRRGGTERAFSGALWDHHGSGSYRCDGCDAVLVEADAKYDSGTGWPSFHQPAEAEAVTLHRDVGLLGLRTGVRCRRCGGHLGHVFGDGPVPTGERYCINDSALVADPS
jgi:peptide-methionine (R)-S-oxide reductase